MDLDLAPSGTGTATTRHAEPRPRRFALVRAFVFADFITLANASAGMGGMAAIGPGRVHPVVALYALSGCAMMSGRLRIPKP